MVVRLDDELVDRAEARRRRRELGDARGWRQLGLRLAHALVDELFEGEDETPSAPAVSLCDKDADSSQKVEVAPETAEAPDDFGGKIEDSKDLRKTKMSYGEPAVEVVEYEPEGEPRGVSLGDSEAAATLCASVGVERVKVVLVDDTKPEGHPERITLARDHTLAEFREQLPYYLERNRRSAVERIGTLAAPVRNESASLMARA